MKFDFKDNAKAEIGTESPWYAISDGGYLKPELVLEQPDQAKLVNDAVKLITDFFDQCYENGVLEEED